MQAKADPLRRSQNCGGSRSQNGIWIPGLFMSLAESKVFSFDLPKLFKQQFTLTAPVFWGFFFQTGSSEGCKSS